MRDADQGSKQVEGIEISAQIATLLSALHQLIDGALDQAARTFIEPGRASDDCIESGRNDVLCRDVVNQQQHPGSKRFERRHGLGEAGSGSRKFLHFIPVNAFDQLIPRREMAIQGTRSNARLLGDFVQTGIGALSGKGFLRNFKDTLAVAQRVYARFAGGCGMFLGHRQKILETGDILRLSTHSEAVSVLVETASFGQS